MQGTFCKLSFSITEPINYTAGIPEILSIGTVKFHLFPNDTLAMTITNKRFSFLIQFPSRCD